VYIRCAAYRCWKKLWKKTEVIQWVTKRTTMTIGASWGGRSVAY
jgi:hypothetical protein